MDSSAVKRRLTCILAADAVGYSRLTSEDEEGTLRVLAAHRAVIDGVIAFHDGRIIGTAGDSVLAEFGSAVEAVRCAVEIQDALRTRNEALPEHRRLLFRVGVNLGDVVVKGGDLLGDGVNIAARLESIADPGGIVIASSVYDQITGKLDLGFRDIGEQTLKNITHPVRAFKVSGAGGTVRPAGTPAAAKRRNPLPWIAAAVAIAGIVAVVAYKDRWLPGSSPPQSATVAPAERARLEAELATAEKARQEAEARARAADAEALRARAESEAAALKAKAESEATALRAKAEADAAALRSRTALDAQRAAADRARAESDAASAKALADATAAREKADREAAATRRTQQEAATAAASAPATRIDRAAYDGVWSAVLSCDAFENLQPFSETIPAAAANGRFTIEWGTKGAPGWGQVEGRLSDSGGLTLRGNALSRSRSAYGRPIGARFDGSAAGQRFELRGHLGQRNCSLSLVRAG